LAPAIQQGAQFINMMSQQRAAERQAAAQEQSMRLQMAGEGRAAADAARAAELQPFKVEEAKTKSIKDAIEVGREFNKYINDSAADANSPEDFRAFAADIAANPLFQSNIFKNGLAQVVASIPNDPAQFPEWKRQTGLKTIEKEKLYKAELIKQDTADGTRQLAVDPYGNRRASVVPGSEVNLGQEVTYVRGGDGSVRAMPKRLPVGGGGGLVGGVRGGGAAGGIQMGQPIPGTGKPAAAAAKPGKTTESERRFGTIAQQMGSNLAEAVRVLTDNPEVIRPTTAEYAASQIPFYGEEARLFAESEARQQFVPAVLRFLDNITFVNTGAGTSKAQEENYRRSYVPTYQDTPGSAHRKLKNMVTFAKNVKSAAGSLWTPQMDADFAALETAVDKLKPPAAAAGTKTPTAKAPAATSTASGVKVSNW
jgi:hypothetical protein